MTHMLFQMREQHGGTFGTMFPDGEVVPWRALTVEEFLEYTELFNSGKYPPAVLEDEIFNKCVLDEYLTKHRRTVKAGVVSTVVAGVMAHSGPHSYADILGRQAVGRIAAQELMHELVLHIIQAFPAYKPEDVYEMDFETFFLRLAQAERKLMRLGILEEPIEITFGQEQQTQAPEPEKPTVPLDRLREMYNAQASPPPPPPKPISRPQGKVDQHIVTKKDMPGGEFLSGGHDQWDSVLLEDGMVDETAPIYQEYQDALNRGEDLRIKTPEERKAAFEEEMKLNEERMEKVKILLAEKKRRQKKLIEEAKEKRKSAKRRRRR